MKAFNTAIHLYDEEVGYGHAGENTKTNEKTARCYVGNVGSMVAMAAQASGLQLSREVIMWAAEYNDQRYAKIGDAVYTVVSANKTGSDLSVKLLLKRG